MHKHTHNTHTHVTDAGSSAAVAAVRAAAMSIVATMPITAPAPNSATMRCSAGVHVFTASSVADIVFVLPHAQGRHPWARVAINFYRAQVVMG